MTFMYSSFVRVPLPTAPSSASASAATAFPSAAFASAPGEAAAASASAAGAGGFTAEDVRGGSSDGDGGSYDLYLYREDGFVEQSCVCVV